MITNEFTVTPPWNHEGEILEYDAVSASSAAQKLGHLILQSKKSNNSYVFSMKQELNINNIKILEETETIYDDKYNFISFFSRGRMGKEDFHLEANKKESSIHLAGKVSGITKSEAIKDVPYVIENSSLPSLLRLINSKIHEIPVNILHVPLGRIINCKYSFVQENYVGDRHCHRYLLTDFNKKLQSFFIFNIEENVMVKGISNGVIMELKTK